MDPLSLNPDQLFRGLLFVWEGFLIVACSIVALRSYRSFVLRSRVKTFPRHEKTIMEFLATGSVDNPPRLPRHNDMKDFVAGFSSRVTGEAKLKLQRLYESLGFARNDFTDLMGIGRERQMLALRRFRMVGNSIPEALLPRLLSNPSLAFRWAVVEDIISVKGKNSLPFILSFALEPRNQHRGIVLHLLCCLACVSSESVAMLLDHTDNEFLVEQILRTLAVYPVAGGETKISKVLHSDSPTETLIAGTKALLSHPSPSSLESLGVLCAHQHWVVRLLIAKGLVAFSDSKAVQLLAPLAEDMSYHVRVAAVQSLFDLRPHSERILSNIQRDTLHPSAQILRQIAAKDKRAEQRSVA